MIENFSSGYYRAEMNVQEYDDGPAIERTLYDFIERELYGPVDAPVMMRVGLDAGTTFPVEPENAMPRDVLAVPSTIEDSRDEGSVFVLKPQYVNTMVGEYYG